MMDAPRGTLTVMTNRPANSMLYRRAHLLLIAERSGQTLAERSDTSHGHPLLPDLERPV